MQNYVVAGTRNVGTTHARKDGSMPPRKKNVKNDPLNDDFWGIQ